ncbi:hypothetical protein ABTX99_01280 [Streptomyces flaveolus]
MSVAFRQQGARLVDIDPAERVATVDGAVDARERAVISELRDRCRHV